MTTELIKSYIFDLSWCNILPHLAQSISRTNHDNATLISNGDNRGQLYPAWFDKRDQNSQVEVPYDKCTPPPHKKKQGVVSLCLEIKAHWFWQGYFNSQSTNGISLLKIMSISSR